MAIKYDVIAKAGTYTNKEGNEKTKWHKCGVVMESGKGLSLKLESLPIGFDGWLNLWEPTPKDAPAPKKSRGDSGFDDLNEPPF